MGIQVAAFYKFVSLPHFQDLRAPLLDKLRLAGAKGSVLLAKEGINGTIAALPSQMEQALAALAEITPGFDVKFSEAMDFPFKRLKVRLKKEIVTIGNVAADPTKKVGTYVEPQDWNALISDPDVVVIDTRNDYEVRIGTFKGAIDPHTEQFSDFPAYVRQNFDNQKHKKIAMFCTGGIRCEKASSFMKHEGFENVYHLQGGILKYLEQIPEQESLWDGACFVFDERVAVEHGLKVSGHSMCHGCLEPVSPEDRQSPLYEEGVACPKCALNLNEVQRASNRERQRQFMLAQMRGRKHLGPVEK
jgi:UPF0176 protein